MVWGNLDFQRLHTWERSCLPLLLQTQHALTRPPFIPPSPARLPAFSLLVSGITTHPARRVRNPGLFPVTSHLLPHVPSITSLC